MLNLRYFWNRAIGVSGSCCGGDVARERRRERRHRRERKGKDRDYITGSRLI